jgi:hypothetical protein
MQDARGVWRRAREQQPDTEQERPVLAATSGEGASYKPMAKGNRAGRESEGFIVPLKPVEKTGRGKGPCFGRAGDRR